ncbi:MAG: GNAT family N-acetyltransferase [Rhizobiaceae bacterium]|nr:GNAT family N-acetyltransferase [Rhizobiaceae bacterium]
MTFHHRADMSKTAQLVIRTATHEDRQTLQALQSASTERLLDPFLTESQRRTMRQIAPFDHRLIVDGTYYVAEVDGAVAASGGWSKRAALYRSADEPGSGDRFLDPRADAAIVRAMYTHPAYARRGLGALVLSTALVAARMSGFRRAELLATPAGRDFYVANGWSIEEEVPVGPDERCAVPGYRMSRALGSKCTLSRNA